jgi:hypothetical protein
MTTITTVSPVLAALFIASGTARVAVDRHQREVLDVPSPAGMSPGDRRRHVDDNNALNDAAAEALDAVAGHPADTVGDLHAKLAFMVKEQMGDGQDWLPTILEDVGRIGWLQVCEAYRTARAEEQHLLTLHEERHEAWRAIGEPDKEAQDAFMGEIGVTYPAASDATCAAMLAVKNYPVPTLTLLAEKGALLQEFFGEMLEGGDAEVLIADIKRIADQEGR